MLRSTLTAAFAILAATASAQERLMNVEQGPDVVFDRPVHEILPELAGATATHENGRVGNELVFWGYRLADGRDAYFFACALRDDVDCDARIAMICPGGTDLMSRLETVGEVRELKCRDVAAVGAGDLRPGCTDRTQANNLTAGLVQCS
jgi:hypothetical protein